MKERERERENRKNGVHADAYISVTILMEPVRYPQTNDKD